MILMMLQFSPQNCSRYELYFFLRGVCRLCIDFQERFLSFCSLLALDLPHLFSVFALFYFVFVFAFVFDGMGVGIGSPDPNERF